MSDSGTYPAKPLTRYAAAVLAVAIALACTVLALPLTDRSQLFLLLAAVVLSAWYGGPGPGLVAAGLGAVAQLAFVEPPYGDDVVRTLLFLVMATVICVAAAGRRRTEGRTRGHAEELAVTLASIGDAVVVADEAGRVTFMNAAAERLTGWPARE
ncbi:MAG TPA: DUF4118 domain-containing protein, partial [Methylomirabilota bacterium]|nr:DUF4118 domain-containing protein [Methylomirabilota bacterium]